MNVTHDAARDAALAIAAAIPVVAVAYYTVRGSDPRSALVRDDLVGFDIPEVLNNRFGRSAISFLWRAPVVCGKVWVGEELLLAADGAFVGSFGPGVLAALLSITTDGNPRWLALSVVLLFNAIGQLVTYVTVTTFARRAAMLNHEPAHDAEVTDPAKKTAKIRDIMRAEYRPSDRTGLRRAYVLIRRSWVRLQAIEPIGLPRSADGGRHDVAPFRILQLVVLLQITLAIGVLAFGGVLFFGTHVTN